MKKTIFGRIEPTGAAIRERVTGDWNKMIVIYATEGKKVQKLGDEPYTRAKIRLLSRRIMFLPEKTLGKPETITQDISSIQLIRK